jgi:aryl carrier-like protein
MKTGGGNFADSGLNCKPFFKIWRNQIAAAQLSASYRREGIPITMEQIVTHPTMHFQALLVSQRSAAKQ